MPRRRMIDPIFWDDRKVGKLTRDERSLITGCVGHADDEGRLQADPAYLKAAIFKYDNDLDSEAVKNLRDNCLSKMQNWPENHPYQMVLYTDTDEEYIYFPSWYEHQAPSHPQPSKLPSPPNVMGLGEPFTDEVRQEVYERDNYTCQYCSADLSQNARLLSIDHVIPLTRGGTHHKHNLVTACKSCNLKKKNKLPQEVGMALIPTCKVNPMVDPKVNPKVNPKVSINVNHLQTQDRSGQSSQGKVSLGQVSRVEDDFMKFLHSQNDLTDFLTKTLTKYMSAGRERAREGPEATPEKERATAAKWGMPVIEKFWTQAVGTKLSEVVWQGAYSALQKYPINIIALAFVKAGPYGGGKHKTWKYIQAIIDEEMEKHGRGPPHS